MLEVLDVLEVSEVMRRVLLCILKAVEGGFYVLEALEVPEVMRRVLLCTLEAVELSSVCGRCLRRCAVLLCILEAMRCATLYSGGDALCATLYSGGCGELLSSLEVSEIFGGAGGDTLCAALYVGGCGGVS